METYSRPVEVLLVDDSQADIRLTKEAFKEWQVANHISVVTDGAAAIEFLHREGEFKDAPRPDVVLLDLNLPRKNGPEVLEEIKNDPDLRRIPVMVMSTSNLDQDLHRAYDLHANCYIAKPGDLERYMDVVRSIEQFWFNIVSLPPD